MKNIIITGGAGFIGSHVVRLFVNKYSEYRIINVDVLTYAGNLENLSDIESAPNYVFERVDIVDAAAVDALFDKYQPEGVIHLAAESHVDRSIKDPLAFVRTNILGTVNLLNSFKRIHEISKASASTTSVPTKCTVRWEKKACLKRLRLRSKQSVQRLKSIFGPLCACLWRDLRHPLCGDQLLEQLRPKPIPRKTHPALHQ